MDTLQRSSGMLSALSLAGLVMSDVYFYRRLNGMQNEIDQVTDSISNFSKTDQNVSILDGNIRGLVGLVNDMQKELKELKSSYEDELENSQELRSCIADIIEELEKNGIDIELSSMKPKKLSQMSQKKKSRPAPKSEPKEEEEEDAVSFVQRLRSRRN